MVQVFCSLNDVAVNTYDVNDLSLSLPLSQNVLGPDFSTWFSFMRKSVGSDGRIKHLTSEKETRAWQPHPVKPVTTH